MGVQPFPSDLYACIHPDGYSALPEEDVTVQQASDLSELRIHNGTRWRCAFTLKTRTAAQRATLLAFRAARGGSFDSFPFTAPDDGVTRRVRFDEVSESHVARGVVWEYRISLAEEL